jgi:hypothetical protein
VAAADDKPTGGEESRGDEPFLARWSRRKSESDAAPEPESPERSDIDIAAAPGEATAPALTDEDMPPVESLRADSDFTGFMSPGVSEQLRRAALRKLFSMSEFNVTDGLNDYDEDYTEFTTLGDVLTHEMRRLRELKDAVADGEDRLAAADGDTHTDAPEAPENRKSTIADANDEDIDDKEDS